MAENLNKPGVYRGQQKLATQEDLALLRQELRQLIAGPISEISENGYIPWKYNVDGSLDVEYLFPEMVQSFQENTGLTITRNGISYADNIKALNFKGNYVFLNTDGDGNLVIDIRPPKHEVSRFNDIDGTTDSLVRIRNKVLSGAIVPTDIETQSDKSIYGPDWEPGEVHEYFNWNGSQNDILTLSTNESVYASDQNSYFKIAIYDGYFYSESENIIPEPIAKFITKPITGKKYGLYANTSDSSPFITVNILEAKTDNEDGGISFIPEFKFNLYGIFNGYGQRFHIEITHEDGIFHNKYVSKDYLYNIGTVPVVNIPPKIDLPNDSSTSGRSKYMYCSGIKYVSEGNIMVSLMNIKNLNNLAAIEDKIKYNFDLVDNINAGSGHFERYDLTLNNDCDWSITLSVNNNTFCNTPTSGYVILKNAFGESETIEVPVKVLVNTKKDLPISDNLNEYFSDESQRKKNSFESYSNVGSNWTNLVPWDSTQKLTSYDNGTGLMVVPGVGLMYPQGNWEDFHPMGNPNYNNLSGVKYFSRIFVGTTKIGIRYGGKFIFKGISKADVLDNKFSCLISKDYGETWFSLKHVRGTEVTIMGTNGFSFSATGILTNINDIEDGVEISWAYPSNIKDINDTKNTGYTGTYAIYFKLGLSSRSPVIVKSK